LKANVFFFFYNIHFNDIYEKHEMFEFSGNIISKHQVVSLANIISKNYIASFKLN